MRRGVGTAWSSKTLPGSPASEVSHARIHTRPVCARRRARRRGARPRCRVGAVAARGVQGHRPPVQEPAPSIAGYGERTTARYGRSRLRVEILDLGSFGGGLTPVARVGGRETKGLACEARTGATTRFRAIDKDPTSILPEELQRHLGARPRAGPDRRQPPGPSFVVDELMDAAGILHAPTRLVVMPDDPRLGEFRKEFAGVVGQLSEFPGGELRPESRVSRLRSRSSSTHEFYARLAADPRERADARAFLEGAALRPHDRRLGSPPRPVALGASSRGRGPWQPIPDDRDQAFSRYEGLVLGLARRRVPILQSYGRRVSRT